MHITAQGCRLRYDLYCVEWDVKLYYTIQYPLAGALSNERSLMSDVCLSVAYVKPKLRTEMPRKTKIGTEVAHVTRDADNTLKVKRSKVKITKPLFSAWP